VKSGPRVIGIDRPSLLEVIEMKQNKIYTAIKAARFERRLLTMPRTERIALRAYVAGKKLR